MKLNDLDKKRIKLDIKLPLVLSLIFFGTIMLIFALMGGIMFFFFNPTEGIIKRILFIFLYILVLFLLVNLKNALKYIELKIDKKNRIQFDSYKLIETKKSDFISTKKPKLKIKIDKNLIQLINTELPLILEYTKYSKTILFISNGGKNILLEEMESKIE